MVERRRCILTQEIISIISVLTLLQVVARVIQQQKLPILQRPVAVVQVVRHIPCRGVRVLGAIVIILLCGHPAVAVAVRALMGCVPLRPVRVVMRSIIKVHRVVIAQIIIILKWGIATGVQTVDIVIRRQHRRTRRCVI